MCLKKIEAILYQKKNQNKQLNQREAK